MNKTSKVLAVAVIVVIAGVLLAATPAGRVLAIGTMNFAAARAGVTINLGEAESRLRARLGELPDPAQIRLVISKSERTATVFDGDRAVATYPVALGTKPTGHKQREGDGRTPEGTYRVCTRLDKSRYHLFLGLSYPGPDDAQRGLAEGVITQRTLDNIVAADTNATAPPWEPPLGGAVGLHGGGTGSDWTLGCIAFENDAIEEIWLLTQMGTLVEVRP